ncbi:MULTISPECIES: hypothetical protein [unclassified Microcoleus]|uniref:hypothetical protein n=1 Tax=unclassified Microcoleus TaxID=2642155 RepID=UPI002FD65B20
MRLAKSIEGSTIDLPSIDANDLYLIPGIRLFSPSDHDRDFGLFMEIPRTCP